MPTTRTNHYAGPCADCRLTVPAETGVLTREGGRWVTRHIDCNAVGEAPLTASRGLSGVAPIGAPVPTFPPTPEQQAAIDLFASGNSMVIEAGAGTGKTATLLMLANSAPERRGQYLAFNKAIVTEAGQKFPANVACNTAHSLAYRWLDGALKSRMNGPRQSARTIATIIGVTPFDFVMDGEARTLGVEFLAGRVMEGVRKFCQSADATPERKHFPYVDGIDTPTEDGRRTFANNDELATAMVPFVRRAWADLSNTDGQLRFGHDHYLKLWQLSAPRIEADFILFDEAQDANPVMAAVVAAQTHAQVVYVGDSQQAIYEFTGAVNALSRIDSEHRVFLTQSFRFGPAIAEIANGVLDRLGADLRLVGTPTIESVIGITEREDAVLCRTNATAVETVLAFQEAGRRPHLVGGGKEVVSFAKAARDLQATGRTSHSELACFDSWAAVQDYVTTDDGGDLKLLVGLVDKFGIDTILTALDRMPSEANADVIVSTAHKSKGREWDKVRLASDFPVEGERCGPAEMRLLYVAVTRGKLAIDIAAVAAFFEGVNAETGEAE